MLENMKIREAAQNSGIKLWEIAERVGITDSNFSRKLRRELPEEEEARILAIIDEIAAQKGAS